MQLPGTLIIAVAATFILVVDREQQVSWAGAQDMRKAVKR